MGRASVVDRLHRTRDLGVLDLCSDQDRRYLRQVRLVLDKLFPLHLARVRLCLNNHSVLVKSSPVA